jgi:NAD(P)-dependent dehydrogenase (short-subunit alcohol dehydrogenase family)
MQLARLGARVVVNDIAAEDDTHLADLVVEEIRAYGGVAVANIDSVADERGVNHLVETAIDEFGAIDVLVNNAGIVIGRPWEIELLDDYDAMYAVHLRGSFLCAKAVFPHMQARGYGRIVNDSSSAGFFGLPTRPAYGALKAAVAGFSRSLAQEGRSCGVLSNVVLPRAAVGRTPPPASQSSDMPAWLRQRTVPDYVAPLVVYLASESCALTGRVLSASGGWFARSAHGEMAALAIDTRASFERLEERMDAVDAEPVLSYF